MLYFLQTSCHQITLKNYQKRPYYLFDKLSVKGVVFFVQDQIDPILYRNIPMPDAKRADILFIFHFFGILMSSRFFQVKQYLLILIKIPRRAIARAFARAQASRALAHNFFYCAKQFMLISLSARAIARSANAYAISCACAHQRKKIYGFCNMNVVKKYQ